MVEDGLRRRWLLCRERVVHDGGLYASRSDRREPHL